MASIRRTLSSQAATTTTGTYKPDPSSSALPGAASVSSPFWLAMEGVVKDATKMSSWKRLLIQFGVCFAIGLLVGYLSPPQWHFHAPDPGKPAVEADLFFGRSLAANAATRTVTESVTETASITAEVGNSFSGAVVDEEVPLEPRKLLIVVTPTYTRAFTAYYLTRLAHTLKLVPAPLLWLVVEMRSQSVETAALLRETGLMYRHLVCDKNLTHVKDRGTHQRNTALAHIEQHQLNGIVYFADDDNVYTLELFEQMRHIKRFGTWLVGMLAPGKARAILEGPVCQDESVIGWHTNEKSKRLRRFHVDMCGFAFNSTILWDPHRWKRPSLEPIRQLDTIKEGFQETTFIEQLVPDESHMEGRPPGCLKVMVWHMHLEAPKGFAYPSGWTLTTPLQPNIPFRKDQLK